VDLCSLIDRNAAFAPDKTAIAFEGERLSYAAFAARIERTAATLKQELGVVRGDRVAILSLNRPDYLVLLYACARLGAMLVPLNWRLAIAEQLFILTDAGAKVLVLEQAFEGVLAELQGTAIVGLDFEPPRSTTFENLLARSEGTGRNPHTDLSCPLLIVYTSGTTGRPKGAVLRQEALFWNGVMSQHMHNMTSDDHVLTLLPYAVMAMVEELKGGKEQKNRRALGETLKNDFSALTASVTLRPVTLTCCRNRSRLN
jgi:fatty-acyl-CoA synthase